MAMRHLPLTDFSCMRVDNFIFSFLSSQKNIYLLSSASSFGFQVLIYYCLSQQKDSFLLNTTNPSLVKCMHVTSAPSYHTTNPNKMGNCVALCKPSIGSCIGAVMAKHEKVLQVVKTDGKVLEFKAPILVKDILVNFSGSAGIGVSRETSVYLPLNYELKIGKIYYILPSLDSVGTVSPAPAVFSSMADSKEADGVKRIKVVLTKQQLQQLLTKQISLEELLPGLEKTSSCSVGSPTNWKPKLESIPEGSE